VRWPRRPRGALRLALCLLALLGAALGAARPVFAEPPKAPFAAAVLPFEDRRHPGQPSWLGRYLQERIARALGRAPQVAVLGLEPAAQWQRKLGLRADEPVTAGQLRTLGVSVLVQGSTQEVLGLAEIALHARTAGDELLAGDAGPLRIALREEPPAQALARVLAALQGALLPDTPLSEPHPAADWVAVERLYTLLGQAIVPGDRAVRPELVARLRPFTADAALAGRAHEALASLLLEQALLFLPQGPGRQLMLAEALQHAGAALQAEPHDTHRQALKAELHYFLRQFHEARTEASIARIRNPLESLAFVVLGLVAGLSTGEATEQFRRAVAIDPFLRTAGRPADSAPFQGGVLEPSFQEWERLRASGGLAGKDDYPALLAEGIAQFDQRNWERAEALLTQAAGREDSDYVPLLYLNRILLELGHPAEAATGLQRLATSNPLEPDVQRYLGVALLESGEPAAAAEAFRKALAERPEDLRSRQGLARAEMEQQHWPQALDALRAVLHSEPDNAAAWLQIGTVNMHLQDWPAAEGALARALELRPDSEQAQQRLAEVRRRGGRSAPAGPAGPTGPAGPAAQPGARRK
jgi:tetratricopeptide (TPR) repeat protein